MMLPFRRGASLRGTCFNRSFLYLLSRAKVIDLFFVFSSSSSIR